MNLSIYSFWNHNIRESRRIKIESNQVIEITGFPERLPKILFTNSPPDYTHIPCDALKVGGYFLCPTKI